MVLEFIHLIVKRKVLKRIIEAGLAIGSLYAFNEFSKTAFTKEARHKMFARDHGTCQNPDCIGHYIEGYARRWDEGWHGQLAHYPELHQRQPDDEVNHGRFLCTHCHIVEEYNRQSNGDKLLYANQTIRNYNWLGQTQSEDQKPPLEFFQDWATADVEGKKGLAEVFRDEYMNIS